MDMNQATYENLDNVDWAALAQQWIHMQDITPTPPAPPPPIFTTPGIVTRPQIYEEKGEADMDVSLADEPVPVHYDQGPWATNHAPAFHVPPHPMNTPWNNSSRPQMPFHINQQPPPNQHFPNRPFQHQNPIARKGYMTTDNGHHQPALLNPPPPVPGEIWSIPPQQQPRPALSFPPNAPPPMFNVSRLQAPPTQLIARTHASSGYHKRLPDNNGNSGARAAVISGVPVALLHHQNHSLEEEDEAETESSLEAAKRKNLPAWIREGLEKMEREKSRETERLRELKTHEQQLELKRIAEKHAMEELQALKQQRQTDKKEEDPLSSEEEEEVEEAIKEKLVPQPKKRTPEEIMLLVRQTLTEVLLEVTNEEIRAVSQEMKQRYQKKKLKEKAKPIRIGGPNLLTQKLGLAAYANSDSEEDEEENDKESNNGSEESDVDSEEELKETIRRRKQSFRALAREMEDQMDKEQEERRKRQKLQGNSSNTNKQNDNSNHGSNDEDNDEEAEEEEAVDGKTDGNNLHNTLITVRDGEPTPLDKNNSRPSGTTTSTASLRSADRKSRFNDPKETVRGSQVTHVSIVQKTLCSLLGIDSATSPLPDTKVITPMEQDKRKDNVVDDEDGRSVASSTSSRRHDHRRRSRERTSSSRRDREDHRRAERDRSRSRDRDSRSRRDRDREGSRDSHRSDRDREERRRTSRDEDRRRRRSRSRSTDRDSRKRR